GSLALDRGTTFACQALDQRGQPRPADGDGDADARCDVGAFEQQTPLTGPAATLTSMTPASAIAGSGAIVITVNGTGFAGGSVAYWNGAPRQTTVASPTQMAVAIPATDLASAVDLGTATVTVVNPGAGAANALPFTIVSSKVASFQSQIVGPGSSST